MIKKESTPPRRNSINPQAHTKQHELPENLHWSLHESPESDSKSLIQEKQYQFKLHQRIRENQEFVTRTLEDTECDTECEGEEGCSSFDSLDETPDEYKQLRWKIESEYNSNDETSSNSSDRYANLRYNPNWKENCVGTQVLVSKHRHQPQTPYSPDSLENSFDDSNDILEKTSGNSNESENEHSDALEQKQPKYKPQAVRLNLKGKYNTGTQTERKRPPSPYYMHEDNDEEFSDSLNSQRSHNETDKGNWRNCRTNRTRKIPDPAPRDKANGDHSEYGTLNDQYKKEYQRYQEHESAHSGVSINHNTDNRRQHNVDVEIIHDRKLEKKTRPEENIVERNKDTLGSRKISTYQQLHNRKKETNRLQQDSTPKSTRTAKAAAESNQNELDDQSCDPERKWKLRAQRLQEHITKKQVINGVRGRPPRPLDKPCPERLVQKALPYLEKPSHHPNPVDLKKEMSEVLIQRSEDNTAGIPSAGQANVSSPISHTDSGLMHNFQPTVHLNINLTTLSDYTSTVSEDYTQTSIDFVPSCPPMGQPASLYRNHGVYGAPPPYNLPHKTTEPMTRHYPHPVQFTPILYVPGSVQGQPPWHTFLPPYQHPGQTQHNPKFHQAAHTGPLAPASYNHSYQPRATLAAAGPKVCSVNQEKSPKMPRDQFGMEQWSAGMTSLPFLPQCRQQLVQSPSSRLIQQMEQICEDTPRLARTQLSSQLVLPSIGRVAGSESELDTRANRRQAATIPRSNSEGYLAQMEKIKNLKEKPKYKPYSLKSYKELKQDIKLGGLGPDYQAAQEKAEKMKRQKEYAKQIKEQNWKVTFKQGSLLKAVSDAENKEANLRRKMAMEYAKTVPKPKPAPAKAKSSNEKAGRGVFGKQVELDPSHSVLLDMLQKRHEAEKQMVAAFKAMHVS
uniref:Uncharacterized protein n=1 Tax=Callorhinchus milii TaxID=7868 RepID=A0A4W3H4N5_CALMI